MRFRSSALIKSGLILLMGLSGCKKLIEASAPVTGTNAANVYADDATASAVLTGIYADMSKLNIANSGIAALSLYPALSGDELTLFNYSNQINISPANYYTDALSSLNTGTVDFWTNIYPVVFVANSALEGLSKSTTLTPSVKQQLLGEAKFVRAFCYFYLVNIYGAVPLALSSDYEVNRLLPRSDTAQVYRQVISDLTDAERSLNDGYIKADRITSYPVASAERIHPNKWAAAALLARAYLYTHKFDSAELQATSVINNTALYDTVSLGNVFLKNNKEAIWQWQPVVTVPTANTFEAKLFVLPAGGPNTTGSYPVYLSDNVLSSFETGDNREKLWVGTATVGSVNYYYPYKYKNTSSTGAPTEYETVLRLAEQYLIRAEARTEQGNLNGAQADVNLIRQRAGLAPVTLSDKASALSIILHERQVELFTEWGHRWFDLKRTGNIDAVMSVVTPQKANGAPWKHYQALYPLPQNDLDRNPKLVQNSGY